MNWLKIETLLMPALLLMGTSLWVRIAMQGFELALVSAATEWFLRSMNRGRR